MHHDVERDIIDQVYRAFVLLGAESDLLSCVGSWHDSLSSEDVLAGLRAWNEATLDEIKGRIEHYEMTFPLSDCSLAAGQERSHQEL